MNFWVVREALLRLAEEPPLGLGECRLAKELIPDERDKRRRGLLLQHALRSAIDHLAPIGTRSLPDQWTYLIYIGEYEEGRSRADVLAQLAISKSAYTRAKRRGLERISAMLPYLISRDANTMDDAAWTGFLDTLTPRERFLVQGMMSRVSHILNSDRVQTTDDMQGLEDRAMKQGQRIKADEVRQDDADARLDADEAEIEAIADRLSELEHPHGR